MSKESLLSALPANFANPQGSPIDAILGGIPLPRMAPISQTFERPVLADVEQAFLDSLRASGVMRSIRPGMTVAVGSGSRGITNLPRVTRLLVDVLKSAGAHPFIFPAMGSHGGATPKGQLAVLERMGFTEESMGCPFKATMDVVELGRTPSGLPACIDAIADKADGIVLVNRIKPHTSFRGRIESGLTKMLVIGAGKQKGAEICHNLGYGRMEENLLALARVILNAGKVLFGVGLMENAYHETCQVDIVPASNFLDAEAGLQAEAKRLMPRVAIHDLDVLVIDEVGKNISGTGFDPNVVGRYPTADVPRTEADPWATRIAVLDITDKSDGNGTGLGAADFTTERVFRKFSFLETFPNLLTSTTAALAKMPMVLRNDRQAIQAAIKTCFIGDPRAVRLGRIRNTLCVDAMEISENLLEEARLLPRVTIQGEAREMAFDEYGNLA